jgi:hypothetical protein
MPGLEPAVEIDHPRIDAKLDRREVHEIIDDLELLLLGDAVQEPDEGKLLGEAEPVLRPPAFVDYHEVGVRQRRLPLQLAS